MLFGLRNPKTASDLKSDLVMRRFQSGPTVHLMGNPAVEIKALVGGGWRGDNVKENDSSVVVSLLLVQHYCLHS